MPFTPSHVAAVLPLCGPRAGRWSTPGALVIGSMIPDLPYFVPSALRPSWLEAGATHALTGPVTVDLVCGLLAWFTWRLLLRAPLTALAPNWLRLRLPTARRRPGRRDCLAAVPSVIVGAATHVLWDAFTHDNRWGPRHVPVLSQTAAGLPVYQWLQYGSGVVGLAAVLVWCLLTLRRTARRTGRTAPLPEPATVDWRPLCWLAATGVLVAGTVLVWVVEAHQQGTWWNERIVVAVVTRDISIVGALVVGYAVGHTGRTLWRSEQRSRRLPDRTRQG